MLKAFPKRNLIFVPNAVCKTEVPDSFKVLLSQRRRWINSTIHNLLELVLVNELCGIFCFSMQFVVFLELIGTVVLPAALGFFLYLIVDMAVFKNVSENNIVAMIFFVATLFSQVFLVVFTKQKLSYVKWMIIFILAMPVWNFILPLYAFWHFDEFSWGQTRKIEGADVGHGESGGQQYDEKSVPFRYWEEYERVRLRLMRYSSSKGKENANQGSGLPSRPSLSGQVSEQVDLALMPRKESNLSDRGMFRTESNERLMNKALPNPPKPRRE
jgi:chitin synthase